MSGTQETLGEIDPSTVTELRVLVDGDLSATTFAVAMLLGVHPDDITADLINDGPPGRWERVPVNLARQAYQRMQEAQAHDGVTDVYGIIGYWAGKDHDARVCTDCLGQIWIDKPAHELWPMT